MNLHFLGLIYKIIHFSLNMNFDKINIFSNPGKLNNTGHSLILTKSVDQLHGPGPAQDPELTAAMVTLHFLDRLFYMLNTSCYEINKYWRT